MYGRRDEYRRDDQKPHSRRGEEKVPDSDKDPLIIGYIEGTLKDREKEVNELFRLEGHLYKYAGEIGLTQNQLRKFYESVVRLSEESESISGDGEEQRKWAEKSVERLSVMMPLMTYSFNRASKNNGGKILVKTMGKIVQKIGEAHSPDEVKVRIGKLKNVYQTIIAYSKEK